MYSNDLICNILKYIDSHLIEKISVDDLCKEFHYNRFYIMKLFKKEMGVTIIYYINALRIFNSAMQIIQNKDIYFTKIALDNGFISLEYFSEIFKSIMHVNPKIFKNSLNRYNDLSLDITLIIHDRLIFLKKLINDKNKYLKMQRLVAYPVKKLSIFQ